MIVVSNSSPFVALAKLARFDLLRRLFSRVYVSAEVRHEVVVSGAGLPGSFEVAQADWIETKHLRNRAGLDALLERSRLGLGELSAIALAKELSADTILLDDYGARSLAKSEGLHVQGTVGVQETCYREGYLTDLRAAFAQFLEHSYIDRGLLDNRLRFFGLAPL